MAEASGQRKNKAPSSSKIRTEHTLRGTTRNSGIRANTHKTDNGVTGPDYTAGAFTGSAPKGNAKASYTVASSLWRPLWCEKKGSADFITAFMLSLYHILN